MPAKRRTFVWRRAPDQRPRARLRTSHAPPHRWQDIGSELAVLLGIAAWGTTPFLERYAVLPQDARNLKSLRALESAAGMTVVGAYLDASHPTAKPAAPDQEGDSKCNA